MPDYALRNAMLIYSRNVAFVSLLISLFTAMLVYAAIDRIMIGPIRAMTRSMLAFSEAPDDPGRIIRPAARADEIGVAERELSQMQERLQKMLDRAEAPRRSRPRRVEDQPRHAQHPRLRAADVGPSAAGEGSDRAGLRAETAARARPRRVLFRGRAGLWPHPGGAAVAPPAAAAPAGRRGARPARHRPRQASNSSTPSSRPSRSTPIPSSCSACSPISAATPCRRWRRSTERRRGAPADRIGRARGQRQPHPRHRHRPRPAAEGARKPVRGVPRLGAQRRHRAWPCHRLGAGARPWRHAGAGRKHRRPHGLRRHHPRPAGPARRGARQRCAARPDRTNSRKPGQVRDGFPPAICRNKQPVKIACPQMPATKLLPDRLAFRKFSR